MIVNFDHLGNYPDGLEYLKGDGGNEILKGLISFNSQTDPNKNEQALIEKGRTTSWKPIPAPCFQKKGISITY